MLSITTGWMSTKTQDAAAAADGPAEQTYTTPGSGDDHDDSARPAFAGVVGQAAAGLRPLRRRSGDGTAGRADPPPDPAANAAPRGRPGPDQGRVVARPAHARAG